MKIIRYLVVIIALVFGFLFLKTYPAFAQWSEPPPLGASGGPSLDGGARTDCCDPAKAFDGDVNTFWAGHTSANVSGGEWRLYYNYGMTYPANSTITLNYYAPYYPNNAELFVSNNGTSWTKVADIPNQATSSFTVPPSAGDFSFLRVRFYAGNATPPYVREIAVEPPPLGASGGPSLDGGARTDCCGPAKAFDGDVNTFWAGNTTMNISSGQWRLYYNYGVIKQVGSTITVRYLVPYYPNTGSVWISPNGTSWTKVGNILNQATNSFSAPASFQYVRLIFFPINLTPPYITEVQVSPPASPTPSPIPPSPTTTPTPTPLPSCYIPTNLSQVMSGKESPTPIIPGVQFDRYFQIQPSSNCSTVDTNGSKRLITVYVTWKDALGNHQSKLSSCLSDWR